MRSWNQIFHVQHHTELIADRFTILVADALGLINVDSQEALLADFPFDVHHVQAQRARHSLGGFADALQIHLRLPAVPRNFVRWPPIPRPPALPFAPNKKVGSRPLKIASGLGL